MRVIHKVALIVAVVALLAGSAALAGGLFVRDNVTDQLTAQQIHFAPKGSEGLPADIQQYGGTQVTNGAQAKVFADDYIAVHMRGTFAGAAKQDPRLKDVSTYSQISSLSRANPGDDTLKGLVDTAFRGEMLRSSLLGAWGWWTFGTIMLWAGVALLAVSGLSGAYVAAARIAPAVHHRPARRPAAV